MRCFEYRRNVGLDKPRYIRFGVRQRPQEQGAPSCIVASASPGVPRRPGGTRRASPGFIPPPRLPLPLVPPGAVLPGAWDASEAGEDVVATLGHAAACAPTHRGAGPSRSWLLRVVPGML